MLGFDINEKQHLQSDVLSSVQRVMNFLHFCLLKCDPCRRWQSTFAQSLPVLHFFFCSAEFRLTTLPKCLLMKNVFIILHLSPKKLEVCCKLKVLMRGHRVMSSVRSRSDCNLFCFNNLCS